MRNGEKWRVSVAERLRASHAFFGATMLVVIHS